MNVDKLKGHAAVLTANVIFGLNIPVTKFLLSGWMNPLGYMLSRTAVATLCFWVASLFVQKEKVSARDLLLTALGGFMGFIVSQYLTAVSLQYTTPVHFSLIVALSPVVVMLLAALFLREPISRQKVAGVALGIAAGRAQHRDRVGRERFGGYPACRAEHHGLWGLPDYRAQHCAEVHGHHSDEVAVPFHSTDDAAFRGAGFQQSSGLFHCCYLASRGGAGVCHPFSHHVGLCPDPIRVEAFARNHRQHLHEPATHRGIRCRHLRRTRHLFVG